MKRFILIGCGNWAGRWIRDFIPETADAARYLIPELVRRGFSLVTLEELASDRGGLEPGRLYRHL